MDDYVGDEPVCFYAQLNDLYERISRKTGDRDMVGVGLPVLACRSSTLEEV